MSSSPQLTWITCCRCGTTREELFPDPSGIGFRIKDPDACACGASPNPLRVTRIRELEAERDSARRVADRWLKAHSEAGEVALAALARADAVEAENRRLRIALHDAIRRPLGMTPDSAVEFYSKRMADEAEERRSKGGRL